MDFRLTEEQEMLRKQVRDFALREIYPHRAQLRKKEFPWDIHRKMSEMGLAGSQIPEEYGGMGLSNLDNALITIELSMADAGVGLGIGASQSLAGKPLMLFGNDEQKRAWLPQLASGEALGAYGQTESGAGSDISAIKTRGVVTGDEIVITGEKQFITNGSIAKLILVLVRTDDFHPRRGLTFVLVDAEKAKREGTLTASDLDKKGLHCSLTSTLFFDGCRVPVTNVLGGFEMGFMIAMTTLTASRPMIAAQSVGVAKAAFEETLKYTTSDRKIFGQRIADFQVTQSKLARMSLKIEAAELLTYQAAWVIDNASDFTPETVMAKASKAKLFASEAAEEIAAVAAKLHGAMGFMAEPDISGILEDSRVLTTYEGTSDIQELIIAREFLRPHGVRI